MKLNLNKGRAGGFLLAAVAALLISCNASEPVMATEVTMYKDPNCGCCGAWARHLTAEGFTVTEKPSSDMDAIKAKYGVAPKLASCHTAIIDGYIIEGHVPAEDIKRLLKERPAVVGLTAPGMPMQSPGMQPEGLPAKNYNVLSFEKDGKTAVYHAY